MILNSILLGKEPGLPQGFQWGPWQETSTIDSDTSPCCGAKVKGAVTRRNILGICSQCGALVLEFSPERNQTRIAGRVLGVALSDAKAGEEVDVLFPEEGVLSAKDVVL